MKTVIENAGFTSTSLLVSLGIFALNFIFLVFRTVEKISFPRKFNTKLLL